MAGSAPSPNSTSAFAWFVSSCDLAPPNWINSYPWRVEKLIELRKAEPKDAEAVVRLWTEAYFREGEGGRTAPYEISDFDATKAAATHFHVAESRGAVVGVVALLGPGRPARSVAVAGEAELVRLVVAASARRRGIGRALVDRCTESARAESWQSIALWSREYQTSAHRLYESLGFARAPERDSVDATGHTRLVFCLPL